MKTKPLEREFAVLNTGAHRSISPGFDGPEGRPAPISLCGLDGKAEAVMDDELAEGVSVDLNKNACPVRADGTGFVQ